jgi:hypothetical protein
MSLQLAVFVRDGGFMTFPFARHVPTNPLRAVLGRRVVCLALLHK